MERILLIHHHVRRREQFVCPLPGGIPASHHCSSKQDLQSFRFLRGAHQHFPGRICPPVSPFQHSPAHSIHREWKSTPLRVLSLRSGTTHLLCQYVYLVS